MFRNAVIIEQSNTNDESPKKILHFYWCMVKYHLPPPPPPHPDKPINPIFIKIFLS